jgi:hypothetical protein
VTEIFNFLLSLFLKDGNPDGANILAALALVVSVLALIRSWNWKPKPRLKFQTDWHEDSPREQGAHDVHFFEVVNVGGAVALDVQVELDSPKDGVGGSTRAYIRTDALNLRVGKAALQPGEHIPFRVQFQREQRGINPKNTWAPFRTKDLVLRAKYHVPPMNLRTHVKKTRVDKFVAKMPRG